MNAGRMPPLIWRPPFVVFCFGAGLLQINSHMDDFNSITRANILVVDDSESLRSSIKNVLLQSNLIANCYEAGTGLEAMKLLLEKEVDLVLCDVVMPEFDGCKFLTLKGQNPRLNEIPVIMLTSQEDVGLKIQTLEQGACDYVVKPFHEGELLARVKVHLKLKFFQDQLKKKNAELHQLAGIDQMTGFSNRHRFMESFERELFRSKRHKIDLSFVIFDIDFFKQVNDRFGHLVGDAVLVQIGRMISQRVRLSDLMGRYGGDELILLLPQTDLSGAMQLAEKIRFQIESAEFSGAPEPLKMTASGGVGSYPHLAVASVDELIQKADEALYRAKAYGRNRIELAR
jgi:two-component system cell cycle response regulator